MSSPLLDLFIEVEAIAGLDISEGYSLQGIVSLWDNLGICIKNNHNIALSSSLQVLPHDFIPASSAPKLMHLD
ncbi:hypothetical protein NIES4101_80140 [Calothrix sp. NIES-4101]|nr:hypothetical protein NIES4101_80140 [Calothrix sp. NIES-4101]